MKIDAYPDIDRILKTTETKFPDEWLLATQSIEIHWVLTEPQYGLTGRDFEPSPEHCATIADSRHNRETMTSCIFDIVAPQVAKLDVDFSALHA